MAGIIVSKDGYSIITGFQRASQKFVQVRVGHAGVVTEEVPPDGFQLVAKLFFVGQLDGGEDPGADQQVEDVRHDEKREVDGGPVPVHPESAPALHGAPHNHEEGSEFPCARAVSFNKVTSLYCLPHSPRFIGSAA